jgi:hypothetical protein
VIVTCSSLVCHSFANCLLRICCLFDVALSFVARVGYLLLTQRSHSEISVDLGVLKAFGCRILLETGCSS